MKDPQQTIRQAARWKIVWRIASIVTTAYALWDPDSRLLFAWVIFVSCHALAVEYEAVKAAAEPSAEKS